MSNENKEINLENERIKKAEAKNLNIVLDNTLMIDDFKKTLSEKQEEITKLKETNKALLTEHKQQFEENMNRPAPKPIGEYDTAPLEPKQQITIFENIDWSDSDLSLCKFKDEKQLIEFLQQHKKNPQADLALKQLAKKAIKDKPLDITYKGKITKTIKTPMKIDLFDNDDIVKTKEFFNSKLKDNLTNWENTRRKDE